MITRASGAGSHTTPEAERRKIKLLYEEIDDTDQVILADPVLETIREKRDLFPVYPFDEIRHLGLQLPCGSLSRNRVSTQPRPMVLLDKAMDDSLTEVTGGPTLPRARELRLRGFFINEPSRN
jgi:hypothetical protein